MFTGRVAVVTGGSRGIGRAIAHKLATAGARIAIFYAENQRAAQETLTEIETVSQGMALQVDVANSEQVATAIQQVTMKWGRIDILVNKKQIGIM
jgi:3-oxoacyl-[acyl-carrier protein] reductase